MQNQSLENIAGGVANGNTLVRQMDIADEAMGMIRKFLESKELVLPQGYSPENAMKSAFLVLQNTQDRFKRPVLETCTRESILNALLDTVKQGLSPAKKQCYYIAYGNELQMERSYFGTITALKTVNPEVRNVVGQVVYADDVFEYMIDTDVKSPTFGMMVPTKHIQNLANIDNRKIVAAYVIILGKSTPVIATGIMTWQQILQSWMQSRRNPFDQNGYLLPSSIHAKFTDQMCLRTVINRVCKIPINSSNDASIMSEAFIRTTDREYEDSDGPALLIDDDPSMVGLERMEPDEEQYLQESAGDSVVDPSSFLGEF